MELGLYEQLISKVIHNKMTSLDHARYFILDQPLESEEASRVLSNHVMKVLRLALDLQTGKEKITQQIRLANKIIKLIAAEIEITSIENDLIETQGKILLAVYNKLDEKLPDLANRIKAIMPYSRLSQSELFTGNNLGISLDSEMRKEIASCNEIYILVSFIRFSGIRIFQKELEDFTNRGGKLKVITTSYMGATDLKAIQFLSSLKNSEIKISYNTTNERLHAKAYLFLRDTGFDTGYIGSSNISRSALTNGLEWNIKITTQEVSHLIKKFKNTFDSYWLNSDFEIFKRGLDDQKLSAALNKEKKYNTVEIASFFNIKPYKYQQEILDTIISERTLRANFKNLIVAATGTGKTVISAFDYKRFRAKNKKSRLLFIAHRKEILEQSLSKFRGILRDNNFGDLWVDGMEPSQHDYLFASIQTINNRLKDLIFKSDYFDYIVIDEVHHISANSYRPLLQKFNPKILLGLTATPERNDGANILSDFNDKITAEIRLPEALNKGILSPFHYFAITDNVDLTQVQWKNGKYVPSELSKLYTSNDQRVGSIIQNIDKYINDKNKVKALGFCVTQDHAQYMAEKFTLAGLKADYLTSNNTNRADRKLKRQLLTSGQINYLFVVDIFNEGIDIPEIDTVLFLRPTESLTVFLQQLGRGLRLAKDKDCLSVLDFVGNYRPEYDYQTKFRALVGRTNTSIIKEVENNFPKLPLGCSIVLERIAKQRILRNIKAASNYNTKSLVQRIINFSSHTDRALTISNFIDLYQIPIQLIYKRGGWTKLLYDAGKIDYKNESVNSRIKSAIEKKWLSCSSYSYFTFIIELTSSNFKINWKTLSGEKRLMAMMLYYDIWQDSGKFKNLNESFNLFSNSHHLVNEMNQVAQILRSRINYIEKPIQLSYSFPLKIHGRYTRSQILAASGESTLNKKSTSREGSLIIKSKNTELLFVTLEKSEENYSPTTLYEDYAISEQIFHWQSQNSTKPTSAKGQSYINQIQLNKTVLLFVRERNKDEYGNTFGFVFLGRVHYISHTGSQPMSINWKLEVPVPNFLWKESAKLALG